jgi:hypothetical protein
MLASLTLRVRSLARRFGLIRVMNRLGPIPNYEDRFQRSLKDAIQSGDHVWDVGANVGLYTELFCQWVALRVLSVPLSLRPKRPKVSDAVCRTVRGFR